MPNQNIKSAGQVVIDFLDSLSEKPDLDAETVIEIKTLRAEGKLTKTTLLRSLEANRAIGASLQTPPQKGAISDD